MPRSAMSPRRGKRTVVLAVVTALVALAGCQAPVIGPDGTGTGNPNVSPSDTHADTAEPEPTETHTADTDRTKPTDSASPTSTPAETTESPPPDETDGNNSIAVAGGNLSLSADRIFADVRDVMAGDVTAPEQVTVLENESELADVLGGGTAGVPRFYELLGLEPGEGLNGTAFERMENGLTFNSGFIYILKRPDGDPGSTEWVLAHEFGHYVNLRVDRVTALRSKLGRTTDDSYIVRAVREGATILTTDAYLARHGNRTAPTAPLYDRLLAAVSPGEIDRYGFSQYAFGHRYVADRVDDPADLDGVFENPPRTSEQVIHGYAPDAEPPAELNVTVNASGAWRSGGSDRLGEAFVRYALENGVSPERAAEAAAGWGSDRLYYLRPTAGGNSSYAWTFRWDDAANASEFERTLRDYLDERGERGDDSWSLGDVTAVLHSPTDRTTVLVVGNESVVDGTVVTAPSSEAIRLELPGSDS
ncbi:hypothetical protein [Halorhabdus tiamatea]|nr:hypothetical protein [Halorhabdus tiamatea]